MRKTTTRCHTETLKAPRTGHAYAPINARYRIWSFVKHYIIYLQLSKNYPHSAMQKHNEHRVALPCTEFREDWRCKPTKTDIPCSVMTRLMRNLHEIPCEWSTRANTLWKIRDDTKERITPHGGWTRALLCIVRYYISPRSLIWGVFRVKCRLWRDFSLEIIWWYR